MEFKPFSENHNRRFSLRMANSQRLKALVESERSIKIRKQEGIVVNYKNPIIKSGHISYFYSWSVVNSSTIFLALVYPSKSHLQEYIDLVAVFSLFKNKPNLPQMWTMFKENNNLVIIVGPVEELVLIDPSRMIDGIKKDQTSFILSSIYMSIVSSSESNISPINYVTRSFLAYRVNGGRTLIPLIYEGKKSTNIDLSLNEFLRLAKQYGQGMDLESQGEQTGLLRRNIISSRYKTKGNDTVIEAEVLPAQLILLPSSANSKSIDERKDIVQKVKRPLSNNERRMQ